MKKVLAIGITGAALAAGCQGVVHETGPQAIYSHEFKDNGNEWAITCYGPTDSVKAKAGDTLLRLVLNNTDLVQPVGLGQSDVPQEFYVQAVAQINQLDDPDMIIAGSRYELPERCQPEFNAG